MPNPVKFMEEMGKAIEIQNDIAEVMREALTGIAQGTCKEKQTEIAVRCLHYMKDQAPRLKIVIDRANAALSSL